MEDISIVGFRSINALCKSRKGYKEQLYINKMSPMVIAKKIFCIQKVMSINIIQLFNGGGCNSSKYLA